MGNIISRCNTCGEFLNSKKELKEHIDKNHRITDSKIMMMKAPVSEITVRHKIKSSH
jgi:uncharacterized C2H2 Zn-finger protein